MARFLVPALVLLTLAASGCGKNAPTAPQRPTPSESPAGPQAPVSPSPAAPGGLLGPGNAGPAVAALQQAWAAVHTLSASYSLWEKGDNLETATVKFYFKKPGLYRYEVSNSTDLIKNGSTSVFNTQTRTITSRLGGVASIFPIKGTLDDDRAKSSRGYTLDKTDYASQLQQFLLPGAQVKLVTPPGYPAEVLELAHPALTPDVDVLRVTLDAQKRLPVAFEMLAGGQSVYRKHFTDFHVNPNIGSEKFSL